MENNEETKNKNNKKKGGLKGLFEEMDAEKKKKKNKKKSDKNTKTKPDFSKFTNNNNYSSDFKGLQNFGNSCYSNVVIQILTSIPEFLNTLSKRYSVVENENDLYLDYPILSRVIELISNYKSKNTSLASKYLKEIVNKFDTSGSQNDAHEFLVFLLDQLNIELLKIENKYNINNNLNNDNDNSNNINDINNKNNDEGEWEEVKKNGKTMKQTNSIKSFHTSILGEVFQGIIKQDIIQKGKSTSNCQIEPFFTLHLDNDEKSIEDMFEKFCKKKLIEGSDKYIQTFIEKCPNIFIVNAKGFYYDKKYQTIVKIKRELIFGEKLILKKDYVSPHLRNKNIEYELIGIIVHKGNLASEGHYVCYCKDNKDKTWFYLDDNKVIKVSEDVIHKLRPYILFYKKNS